MKHGDHYEQENEDTARYHDHPASQNLEFHHHHEGQPHYHLYNEDVYHHHEHTEAHR